MWLAGALTVLLGALLSIELRTFLLFVTGWILGITFFAFSFGFASGWRQMLVERKGGLMFAQLAVIALTSIIFIPMIAKGHGSAIAPLSWSLVLGAMLFGIGMQLGNGCGSGTLFTFGGGSSRMAITLPFFMLGGLFGSLHLPAWMRLGGLDPVIFPLFLGPFLAVAINLAIVALVTAAVWFWCQKPIPQQQQIKQWLPAVLLLAALVTAVFLLAGYPWSITFGLTLWGAKIAQALGWNIAASEFWLWEGPARALRESVLTDASSLTNIGMILGAMFAAAFANRFAKAAAPNKRGIAGAVIGGLLMGYGARLGFGCNIGAFLGGTASGSLHGWIWLLGALVGCSIGIPLRPFFGFQPTKRVTPRE